MHGWVDGCGVGADGLLWRSLRYRQNAFKEPLLVKIKLNFKASSTGVREKMKVKATSLADCCITVLIVMIQVWFVVGFLFIFFIVVYCVSFFRVSDPLAAACAHHYTLNWSIFPPSPHLP